MREPQFVKSFFASPLYSREEIRAAVEAAHEHNKLIIVHSTSGFVGLAIEEGIDCV